MTLIFVFLPLSMRLAHSRSAMYFGKLKKRKIGNAEELEKLMETKVTKFLVSN